MNNLSTQGPNKRAVNEMFDTIATSYDPINTLLSFGIDRSWRRRVVGRVVAEKPQRVLDLAAGTGEITLPLAQRLPESHITAADLSEGMLAVAKRKLERKGVAERVNIVVADAEALPFEDESFDSVTLVFGIRNFTAPATALAELYRTTSRGAVVRIMEFGMPQSRVLGALYHFYSRWVMPFVGGILSGKWRAYRYLPTSIAAFEQRVDVARLLEEAGFGEVTTQNLSGGIAKLYTAHKL